jgi:hypothetical protein
MASCSETDSAAKTRIINQEVLCLNITAEDEGMKDVMAKVKKPAAAAQRESSCRC